jgi:sec-independent protein translocase protein TatC
VGFLACYGFSKKMFDVLLQPLLQTMPPESTLIYTSMPEAFFTYIKIAIVGGVFLTSPFIFYQLWQFVAPGLYSEERKYMIPIALFSAAFFVVGAMFGYFIVFPFAFEFFMGFTTEMIKPMPTLKEYLSFSLKLLFAFGIIFELPLFIFFLARLGVVTSAMLRKFRKYAFLLSFVVSALLTPPDVISQLLMSGPLMILYEVSIWVARFFGRREPKRGADKDAEEDGDEDEKEEQASA